LRQLFRQLQLQHESLGAEQQKEINALAASRLKEQASQIQKVSAQVELSKAPAKTVAKQPVKHL